MASSLALASWALSLQMGGAGAVVVGPSCHAMVAVAEPRWSTSSRARVLVAPRCAALDGPGGSNGEVEAKIEEERKKPARGRPVWRRILFASKKTRSIIILNALTVIYAAYRSVVQLQILFMLTFLSPTTVIVVTLIDGLLGASIPKLTWFGAIMSLFGIGLLECGGSPPCDITEWIPALYTEVLSTVLCMWAEMVAMGDVSATETAIVYGLEPVWGAAFAWFLLGERWDNTAWVGAALGDGAPATPRPRDGGPRRPRPPVMALRQPRIGATATPHRRSSSSVFGS
ncbi:uncharacterized protein [Miscanthus floridulus]|uniref:uncharacterized protein n=1 Tax=Miscanthus floridulus TaxID=154761 RepID=UPI003457FDDB